MVRYILALLCGLFPAVALADQAPAGCTKHFFSGDMPNVAADRTASARLLCFSRYAVLHSGRTKTPVWSAEHLTTSSVNAAERIAANRPNNFHAETQLPANERSELSDYQGSGFDRGHMSPSGDMPTRQAQRESFSLANMIPQQPCNNEELWEGIESTARTIAFEQDEIFVITGPVYLSSAQPQQIGQGVLVPLQIFKAIFIPGTGQASAYLVDNIDTKQWKPISLAQLQQLAGVEAFPTVAHKAKITVVQLPPPEPPRFPCRLGRH